MDKEEYRALAGRLERLAGLAAESLERQMAAPEEADPRRARELTAVLKDVLTLARELRGDEAREVTVRFVDGADAGSV